MYKVTKLYKRNLSSLKYIDSKRNDFNILNQGFFEVYSKSIFLEKFLLRRKINLLFFDKDCEGYIWHQHKDKNKGIISSMYISPDFDQVLGYNLLINNLPYKEVFYLCEKNEHNFDILLNLGFKKISGTLHMVNNIRGCIVEDYNSDIEFQPFMKGNHEELRCRIQNTVFESNDRVPLNVEDIYFDEMQDYYLDDGAIFMKYKDDYIGYGQIIIEDTVPTIVNFGIMKEFRQRGFGQDFLRYLLELIYKKGYRQVKIRVNSDNSPAIYLYKKMGFETEGEQFEWKFELKKGLPH